MRKVELLPTRDCEAGYGPDYLPFFHRSSQIIQHVQILLCEYAFVLFVCFVLFCFVLFFAVLFFSFLFFFIRVFILFCFS